MQWLLLGLALVSMSCGSATTPNTDSAVPVASAATAVENTATSDTTSDPLVDETPPSTTWPAPDEVRWLSLPEPIEGVRLISATRQLGADCGPDSDCLGTIPEATLLFATDDLAHSRTLTVTQFFDDYDIKIVERTTNGEQRTIGSRNVNIVEQGTVDAPYITAGWEEPEGFSVELSAAGLSIDIIETVIESLEPSDPSRWPTLDVQERLTPCVDNSTRYAPSAIPSGWNRFILEAQPTGTCDVSVVLFMSLVEPGTESEPGTLVTFVSTAAGATTPQPGQAIEINGNPAVVQETTDDSGNPATFIYLTIGDVIIDGHGIIDRESLETLMASITLFDEQQWAQLVAEIDSD